MRSELIVPAADGFVLSAVLHEPDEGSGDGGSPLRAAVVIAPAMGVRKRTTGRSPPTSPPPASAVLCVDYREMGGSLPGRLSGFRARLHEWGELDLDGALGWLAGRWPRAPLLVVSHSARQPGVRPRAAERPGVRPARGRRPDRALALLTGDLALDARVVLVLLAPILVALFGYLPMRLVTAARRPRGGRHRDYVLSYARAAGRTGYWRFARLLRAYSFTDDLLAPPRAVERLLAFYRNAESELRILAPADLGADAHGHFAPFRERFRDSLWAESREWLERAATAA